MFTLRLLARRSLRYYFRAHLGVLSGATLAAAVLIGALAVGDSVRESLKDRAWRRVGVIAAAIRGGDRFFQQDLLSRDKATASVLSLPATITRQDGTARANRVTAIGVRLDSTLLLNLPLPGQSLEQQIQKLDPKATANQPQLGGQRQMQNMLADRLPPMGSVTLNATLAAALRVQREDNLVLRIHKPSAISRDAVITPRDDQSIALRVKVWDILNEGSGDFSLEANQTAPSNVFIDMDTLALATGLTHRANLLLYAEGPETETPLESRWLQATSPHLPEKLGERANNRVSQLEFFERDRRPVHYSSATTQTKAANTLLNTSWTLADAELFVRTVTPEPNLTGGEPAPAFAELTTRRIFLEPAVVAAAVATNSAKVAQASRLPLDETQGDRPTEARIGQSRPTVESAPKSIGAGGTPALPSPTPVLTYLVNSLAHGDDLAPYSMVTAAGPPYTPADLRDDEIVVNDWLAADLGVKPGDTVALAYYRVDAGTQLVERTNVFRVRSVVPLRGLHADRTLMPEFPGLTKAESTRDWDAGFDLVHPIRDADEKYWKQWRGTPKAFISLAAGQKMWANRFGDLTAIRWFVDGPPSPRPSPPGRGGNDVSPAAKAPATFEGEPRSQASPSPGGEGRGEGERPTNLSVSELRDTIAARIRANLNPADVGLRFTDVRTPALAAAETGTGQEFGGLMIGFSFFLIASALLLTAMLFSFSLEQRATESGLLLALGWEPRRVRRLLFREGFALAALGTLLGTIGGIYYAKGVLWGLKTIWRDAVNGAGLEFHLTAATLVTGIASSLAVAALTLWLTLRKQAKRPARELLNEGANEAGFTAAQGGSKWALWWAIGASLAALGVVITAWTTRESSPENFFGAGALLLIAGLLWVRLWLRCRPVPKHLPTLNALSLRGLSRRPSRSLGTVALLASATFLIIAVGANKLDANRDATKRSSGTGGFALWAESSLPVIQDLNGRKGQEFYGLDPKSLANVSFVPFRVRDGDDASCLNLNKAQHPRLLGVKPELLAQRGAFTFTGLMNSAGVTNGWLTLSAPTFGVGSLVTPSIAIAAIPAIADANSIQWALQKQLGDTLDYVDERGRPFKVRLVGAVANSILQGSVIIDETEFVKRFPSEGGYRAFLIDGPTQTADALSATLSRALQDTGLEATPAARRLTQFNAVQNTYLNTFQILGGLGLLLGSVGLGVVVLRNVFERRGELAVMQAVGFERASLQSFVLKEHVALLLLGLFVGTVAALVAVLPAIVSPGAEVPWLSLSLTLLAVLLNGALWTWLATRRALRGRLVDSLRLL